MKNLFWIVIAIAFSLAACKKSKLSLPEDSGCIERTVVPVTAHSINSADIATVNNLFSNNGIDNSKFRYYQYSQDTIQTYFPPYAKIDDKVVKVDQYVNGLKLFEEELIFDFQNNAFAHRIGNITKGTTLNTSPQLELAQMRKLFLDNIEEFDHTSAIYRDSCFKAEFGYFNLNYESDTTEEHLVKAWKVTLKNSVYPSEYPVAYYADSDGSLLIYDNGIRTFK